MITLFKIFELFDTMTASANSTRGIAHRYGVNYFQEWYDHLTEADKQLIEWYRDCGYKLIGDKYYHIFNNTGTDDNGYNYMDEYGDTEATIQNKIKQLKELLSKCELKTDAYLYKGVKTGKLLDKLLKMHIGQTIKFNNFISTTLDFQYGAYYGGDQNVDKSFHVIKIFAPKGTSGAYISLDELEREFLLNSDYVLVLSNIETRNLRDFNKKYKNSNTQLMIFIFDLKT